MFTLGVQMIKSSLVQVGSELEEASWTSKASWWYTIRRVVFPLSIHSIAVVGILGFVSAGKNVSHLSLLATSDNRPLAIMQLEYMLEGRYEAASIVGLIVVLMIVVVAVAARVLGFNIGTKHD
jgi:iron(III) transport system permease protein